jgi:hypothetical protein
VAIANALIEQARSMSPDLPESAGRE